MREKFASCSFRDFVIAEELYRSRIGMVYKAHFKYDQRLYVLKERKIAELGQRKDILNEVKLLQQLRHQNIVQYEGWFRDEERNALFIVLEYCNGGDLYHYLEKRKERTVARRGLEGLGGGGVRGMITATNDRDRDGWQFLSEKEIWFIFYQICLGLKHLHESGIIHRDIKTLNIFLSQLDDKRVSFKIGDLGVSRQLSENTFLLNTFYGTPLYLSPELIENKAYNEKTDIWSLGIILYELCMLQPPFVANSMAELSRKVLAGEYEPVPQERYPSSSFGRCIAWLLTKDYTKRPNIAQVTEYVGNKLDQTYHGETLATAGIKSTSSAIANIPKQAAGQAEAKKGKEDTSVRPKTASSSAKTIPVNSRPATPVKHARNDPGSDTGTVEEDSLDEISDHGNTSKTKKRKQQQQQQQQQAADPTANAMARKEDNPKKTSPPLRDQGNRPATSDDETTFMKVDIPRIHAKHRREIVKYRKLLQMRDFMADASHEPEPNAAGLSELQKKIQELHSLIKLLEQAMEKKQLPRAVIERFELPILMEKAQPVQLDHPQQAAERMMDDSLPVYLQQPPMTRKAPQAPAGIRANDQNRARPRTAAPSRRAHDLSPQHKEIILQQLWAKDRQLQPQRSLHNNQEDSPRPVPSSSSSAPSPSPRVVYENRQKNYYQNYIQGNDQHRRDLFENQYDVQISDHQDKAKGRGEGEDKDKDDLPPPKSDKPRRQEKNHRIEQVVQKKDEIPSSNQKPSDQQFQSDHLNINYNINVNMLKRENPFQSNQPASNVLDSNGLMLPSMKTKPKQDKHSKFIDINAAALPPAGLQPAKENNRDVSVSPQPPIDQPSALRNRPKSASAVGRSTAAAGLRVEQGDVRSGGGGIDIFSDKRRLYSHNRVVSDVTAFQEIQPKYHREESNVMAILHQNLEDTDEGENSPADEQGHDRANTMRQLRRDPTQKQSKGKPLQSRTRGNNKNKSHLFDNEEAADGGERKKRNKTRIDQMIRNNQRSEYNIITNIDG